MRYGLYILLSLSATLVATPKKAYADMVSPPPATCPAGATPASGHCGPHCALNSVCGSVEALTSKEQVRALKLLGVSTLGEAECDGQRCLRKKLCVRTIECCSRGGCSKRKDVTGACLDGACKEGTCVTLKVCVASKKNPVKSSVATSGQSASSDAPPRSKSKGCGCGVTSGRPWGAIGAGFILILISWIRRRKIRYRRRGEG